MARARSAYQCRECGAVEPKWVGQCPACGAWNALEETAEAVGTKPGKVAARYAGWSGGREPVRALSEIEGAAELRMPSGVAELDRVLGGGLVAGSVVLIGGDPGIGKSTLLLQALAQVAQTSRAPVLYVSGEESAQQVSARARRLGLDAGGVRIVTETNVERILEAVAAEAPRVVVVDSIQTVYTEMLGSAPGSVAQVRESAAQLVRHAKRAGCALFLVGHVTKEGALAGPRVLEHMVDTVLYFEGDTGSRYRVIRAVKNRYGAVNELGVFAMTDKGLREVSNPSAIFLSRHEHEVAGSAVTVTREGTRPLLVEVQALVDTSHLASPRRVTVGFEHNRLAMLLAILHRHAGIATHDQDVFVNVVGGVRLGETAADLPVVLALLSSLRDRPLPQDLVVFGEIGLAGEIRPVQAGPERLREAGKHGFRRAIAPASNVAREGIEGMDVARVRTLAEALERL